MDDDNGDNEMIMYTKKRLYGPFGTILTILAAEKGKTKNKVVQNPTLTCYKFTVLTSNIFCEKKSDELGTCSSLFNKIFKIHDGWQLSASKKFSFSISNYI